MMNFLLFILWATTSIMLFISVFRLIRLNKLYHKTFEEIGCLKQVNASLVSFQAELKSIIWKLTPTVQYILSLLEQGEGKFLRSAHILSKEESQALITACNDRFEGKVSQLSSNYPQLSHEDLLLCCFIRMQIPISCISVLMSKEIDTIYKKKLRIKKKKCLDKIGLTLDEYLFQVW